MTEVAAECRGERIKNENLRTLYKYQLPCGESELDEVYFETAYRGPWVIHPWLTLDGETGHMRIKRGYSWNGADFFPDTEWIKIPSAVHDAFCQLMSEGHLPLKYNKLASQTLRIDCRARGATKFQGFCVYWGTLIYGKIFR